MVTSTKAPPDASTLRGEWVITGRIAEEGEPRSFPVNPLPFRIGRKTGLSLTIPRQTISGVHAEFLERDRRLIVKDCGSTNGTFVNGERLADSRVLHENDLVQFADTPFRVHLNREAAPSHTRSKDACDHALALVQFDRLVSGQAVVPHYQPIIDLTNDRLIAFEALARSRLIGLETPDFMFSAAAQLGKSIALSEVLRKVSVQDSASFPELPHLFLNTHPSELESGTLIESCRSLRELAPRQRITIEIHEAAITQVGAMTDLCRGLEELDMTVAFDDFGAGSSRIAELIEVRPHYLKLDRTLIKNLDTADASRRKMVEGLIAMVREVGIIPLAEGVETAGERDTCVALGFVLAQGYLHGRPMTASHYFKSLAGTNR